MQKEGASTTITVREYLLRHSKLIPCNRCGNCCPSTCIFKAEGSCLAHPAVLNREIRTGPCKLSPVKLLLQYGFACEPVLLVISRITRKRLKTTHHRDPYPHPYTDLAGCTYVEPIELLLALDTRVKAPPFSFIPLPSIQPRENILPMITS